MEIHQLKSDDVVRFNELAWQFGSVFNTVEWTNIFGSQLTRYGIYNKGGELIGGFIIFRQKKMGFSIYRNPPFTPTIGPFLRIDSSNPVNRMSAWKKALNAMAMFVDKLPYSVVTLLFDKTIVDMQPFIWQEFKVIPQYTYVVDLLLSEQELWDNMSGKNRTHINKAGKDGIEVKRITDYQIIKTLVHKTFSRQNKEGMINRPYLEKVLFDFSRCKRCFAVAAFKNNQPIAGSFCVYDHNTAFNIIAGYDHQNKHHGANILAWWEAIRIAQSLGLKQFDFEGSMVPQIEKVFRLFGGKLVPYFRINKAKLPIEILLKFYRRQFF